MAKEKKTKEKESVNYAAAAKNFIYEVVEESKKVAWPTRETLVQSSLTVLGAILILTVFMAVADQMWNFIFNKII